MDKKRLIVDTDAGIDDALAILLALASPEIEVIAITVSSGNCSIAQGVKNVKSILHLVGSRDIPVAKGIAVPLVKPLLLATETHGETGLGYAKLPEVPSPVYKIHAIDLVIKEAFRFEGDLSILIIGPLTNLAMAIRREPEIIGKIKDVIIMGGAILHPGNTTPQAEFNIYCDPHAAHIVFHSGIPITLVPLDVTYQIILTRDHVEYLKKIASPITRFVDDSTRFYMEFHQKYQKIDGCVINDPLALAVSFAPYLVDYEQLFVDVDISNGVSLGKTFADFYDFSKRKANMSVAMAVKVSDFMDLFLDRIAKLAAQHTY
jgi:purine nucleosidase